MHQLVGIILIAVSSAGFGTLAIFGRWAYAAGMDVFSIMFLRFSMATACMAALLMLRREGLPRGKALLGPLAMGALGYVGQAFCYLSALQYASAGLVALLLFLYPLFVTLLAALLLRERITAVKGVALGLALTGTALTVGPAGGQATGILLAILAAVIYSLYIIAGTRVLRQCSAMQSSTLIFAAAAVVSGVLMVLHGPRWPAAASGWGAICGIVLFATVIPVTTFLAGMERIGASNASVLSALEPAVTVALAAALLDERLTAPALLGGGLILLSVALLTRGELRRKGPG